MLHEVLEHRWFMSESTGRDSGTAEATRDYVSRVLSAEPDDLISGPADALNTG